jgi:molecular chaperone GrpE
MSQSRQDSTSHDTTTAPEGADSGAAGETARAGTAPSTEAPADARSEGPGPEAAYEARIQELEARLRAVSAAYRQKQDEIDAVKDRLARQASVQEEIRRGEVVASLFEPVENLNRSIDASKGSPAEGGLRMVHQQFLDALKRLGLEEVPGAGAPFDPNMHEAIATAPVQAADQDNKVIQVYSAGYRIGNRLIRPARVVIGSYTKPLPEA